MLTGLFFGSFNPVHIGHMALANYFLAETDLKEIWFVVSPHNPLKQKSGLAPERQRLEMARLAIGDFPKMKVSDIEFGMPQPSYTINTLARFDEKYPKKKFALIMGADNLETFDKWKNFETILEKYLIYVYPRPGFEGGKFREHPSVKFTSAPLIEISSTYIRKAIKEKKEIPFLMPAPAYAYMKEMHLYER